MSTQQLLSIVLNELMPAFSRMHVAEFEKQSISEEAKYEFGEIVKRLYANVCPDDAAAKYSDHERLLLEATTLEKKIRHHIGQIKIAEREKDWSYLSIQVAAAEDATLELDACLLGKE